MPIMQVSKADLQAWYKLLQQYQRKPFTNYGANHLLGYLRRCIELDALQPDPYIPQWLQCIRCIMRYQKTPDDELKLVSLYQALAEIAPTNAKTNNSW
jgi:hypothetical protein